MIDSEKWNSAIARYEAKIKTLNAEALKKLTDSLKDLNVEELIKYQELKGIAQLEQRISLDVAMSIYNALENWSRVRLSEKILITQVMAQWLGVI